MQLPSFARRSALAAAALLVACTQLGSDPTTVDGELGRGTFQYECDSSTRTCTGAAASVFPTRVAVDTRFGLSFVPDDHTVALDSLEPASSNLLEVRDFAWRALKPGTVGIMSRPRGGDLEDYTFMTLERAAGVRFYAGPLGDANVEGTRSLGANDWRSIVTDVELAVGRSRALVAEPEAVDGDVLAGEPLLDFACAADLVELLRPSRRPTWFYLVGKNAGTTTCKLSALGFEQSFVATVDPKPDEPPPDPEDAGTDAASPTDAGEDAQP